MRTLFFYDAQQVLKQYSRVTASSLADDLDSKRDRWNTPEHPLAELSTHHSYNRAQAYYKQQCAAVHCDDDGVQVCTVT
jgi:hypothetical protein